MNWKFLIVETFLMPIQIGLTVLCVRFAWELCLRWFLWIDNLNYAKGKWITEEK